jgi:hypothetical protein
MENAIPANEKIFLLKIVGKENCLLDFASNSEEESLQTHYDTIAGNGEDVKVYSIAVTEEEKETLIDTCDIVKSFFDLLSDEKCRLINKLSGGSVEKFLFLDIFLADHNPFTFTCTIPEIILRLFPPLD